MGLLKFFISFICCFSTSNIYALQKQLTNKDEFIYSPLYADLIVKNAIYYADNEVPLHAVSLSLSTLNRMPKIYYQRSLMVVIDQLLKMKMYNTAYYYFEKLHKEKQSLITEELRLFFAKYAYFQNDFKRAKSFLTAIDFKKLAQNDQNFGYYLLIQTNLSLNEIADASETFDKTNDKSNYYALSLFNLSLKNFQDSSENFSNHYAEKLFSINDTKDLRVGYLQERLLIAQSILYLDKAIPFAKEKMWNIRQESQVSEIGKLQLARILIKDKDYANAQSLLKAISQKPNNILIYYQSQLLLAQVNEKLIFNPHAVIILDHLKKKLSLDIKNLASFDGQKLISEIKNPCEIESNIKQITSKMTGYQQDKIENIIKINCELSRMVLFDQNVRNRFELIEVAAIERKVMKDRFLSDFSLDSYNAKFKNIDNNARFLILNGKDFDIVDVLSGSDLKNLEKINRNKNVLKHLTQNKKLTLEKSTMNYEKLELASGNILWNAYQNYPSKKWLFRKNINQMQIDLKKTNQLMKQIKIFSLDANQLLQANSLMGINSQIAHFNDIGNQTLKINNYLKHELQRIIQNEILTLKKIQALADYEMTRIIDLESQ
ncbi:MAG: hypothetical protein V4629_00600 [Pseudomonadota bacterium]